MADIFPPSRAPRSTNTPNPFDISEQDTSPFLLTPSDQEHLQRLVKVCKRKSLVARALANVLRHFGGCSQCSCNGTGSVEKRMAAIELLLSLANQWAEGKLGTDEIAPISAFIDDQPATPLPPAEGSGVHSR